MNYDTHSEELFVAIGQRHDYQVKTLIARSEGGRRTADFKVSTPGGENLIAGVDELVAEKEDLRQILDFHKTGNPAGGRLIGARARGAVRTVALQLRAYRQEGLPLLIVLYDNVRTPDGRVGHPMYYLEACQIDAAMYGDGFSVPKLRGAPGPDWFAEGCTMTGTERTHVSAVAVISDWDDETIFVFHNCFAKIAFPTTAFIDAKCYHFEKRGQPYTDKWKWYKVKTG